MNLNNENLSFVYVSQFIYFYHVQNVDQLIKKFKITTNGIGCHGKLTQNLVREWSKISQSKLRSLTQTCRS